MPPLHAFPGEMFRAAYRNNHSVDIYRQLENALRNFSRETLDANFWLRVRMHTVARAAAKNIYSSVEGARLGSFQPIPGFKQLVFTGGNTFFLAHGGRKPFESLIGPGYDPYLPLARLA